MQEPATKPPEEYESEHLDDGCATFQQESEHKSDPRAQKKEEKKGRPRVDKGRKRKFFVEDRVYLKVGRAIYGPYLVASSEKVGVYTLCTEDGYAVNDGQEVSEADLQRA